MATSRGNQTSRRANTRRTAAKVTETPDATPTTTETPPEAPEASEPTEPISDYAIRRPDRVSETDLQTVEPTPEESHMSNADVIEATATPAEGEGSANSQSSVAIEILNPPSLSAGNRPVMSDDFEVAGTIQSSGIRPIEASHMEVFGTILNGRPISTSNLRVAEMMPGNRPIFYSDFHSVEGSETMGRPVMASEPGLLSAEMLLGNRPVFSNAIDDAANLMGFID